MSPDTDDRMSLDLKKLTADLKDALVAATEAISGMSDGGTCNFDCPYLYTGGQFKRRNKRVEAAIEAAGLRVYWTNYGFTKGYHLMGFPGGQGLTRTAAAKAAADLLSERGWDCSVHYQMD